MKLRGALIIFIIYLILIALTWQTWTQPIIDHGRELNYPVRILNGEHLYTDMLQLYTPFAPYFNALLYKIFGIHMSVLQISGAICGLLILLLIYNISRRLMGEAESVIIVSAIAVLCAVKPNGNYIIPYYYGSDYALLFALISLTFILKYLNGDNSRTNILIIAGLFTGLSILSKQELGVTSAGAGVAAITLNYITERKRMVRDAFLFLAPPLILIIAVFGYILSYASVDTLINKNHILFTNVPPQLKYFNKNISGLLDVPKSLLFTLTGLAKIPVIIGMSGLIGGLLSLKIERDQARRAIKTGGLTLLTGLAITAIIILVFDVPPDSSPLSASIIVLPIIIFFILWHKRLSLAELTLTDKTLIVLSVFGLLSIIRVIINIRGSGPYNPFFTPVLFVIFGYLFFRVFPEKYASTNKLQRSIRYAAMFIITIMSVSVLAQISKRIKEQTYKLSYPRGSLMVQPKFGKPIDDAIKYIQQHTSHNDYVLVLPQGSLINFLAERNYPIRQENVHPGYLEGENKAEIQEQIINKKVAIILIANYLTPEMRDKAFGVEYNQDLLHWIEKHYRKSKTFGPENGKKPELGMKEFFIVAYERNDTKS